MGTFGGQVWGGGGGAAGPGSTGVPVKSLFYMSLRLAHVTKAAQITPSPDQLADALQQAQLMISQANVKRALVYSIQIQAFALTAGKKIYTLGPAGDFDTLTQPRPVKITHANIILPTGTPVRLHIYQGTADDFARLAVQDIVGALPTFLYCDYDVPLANVYLIPQDRGGDQLELHTWQAVPGPSSIDDVLAYPPGYDDWLVNNLAVRLASVFAEQGAYLTDDTRMEARRSTAVIQARNTSSPRLGNDSPGSRSGGGFNYFNGI